MIESIGIRLQSVDPEVIVANPGEDRICRLFTHQTIPRFSPPR